MENSLDSYSSLINSVIQKVKRELTNAIRNQNLNQYLSSIDCSEFQVSGYAFSRDAKILVFGASELSEDEMYRIAKEWGIRPSQLELRIDYKKNKHFNFDLLRDNSTYSDIIFGPNAHKSKGIGDYSSAISLIEHEPEHYPRLVKATNSGSLKITKASFINALRSTRLYACLLGENI